MSLVFHRVSRFFRFFFMNWFFDFFLCIFPVFVSPCVLWSVRLIDDCSYWLFFASIYILVYLSVDLAVFNYRDGSGCLFGIFIKLQKSIEKSILLSYWLSTDTCHCIFCPKISVSTKCLVFFVKTYQNCCSPLTECMKNKISELFFCKKNDAEGSNTLATDRETKARFG